MKYTTEMYHSAMSIMTNRAEQLGISEDELYHHGILGMKWGIRRYQNEDGSLTEEGERRYAKLSERERLSNIDASERGVNSARYGLFGSGYETGRLLSDQKRRKNMTDEEFEEEINRSFERNKKNNKLGRTLTGINYGGIAGEMAGALGGLALSDVIGDDRTVLGGLLIGGILGGTAGGVIGNKTADAQYEKRHSQLMENPNMAYRKRTKKEMAEYDAQKKERNFNESATKIKEHIMSNFNKTNVGDMMKRYDKAKDWYELKDAWQDLDIEIQREIERSYPDMSDQKIREYADKIVTDMGYNPYKS